MSTAAPTMKVKKRTDERPAPRVKVREPPTFSSSAKTMPSMTATKAKLKRNNSKKILVSKFYFQNFSFKVLFPKF